ncbi:MAG: TolC family protein [Sulfurimonas sp.]|uniref:TolC family protein n=1 Tax=Sulfurimonas sp. TaxID=2022749 RepID=UPI0025E18FC9|nr:TolC family protein [Sulfurimonas sp.]MCK9491448.1 TolC family protein [Sulfurimonas sp.]
MRIALIFVFFYTTLFGLTLEESLELALQNSPKSMISKSNVKYNELKKDEASSAYHPTLDAGFEYKELEKTTAFSFSPTHNYNLSLKYNLFRGFTDSSTIDSKEAEIMSARLESKAVVADLKLDVIVAYTNYLKAQKLIVSQEAEFASLTKQYDDTNNRYEQGIIAKNDLLMIDVERLKSEQALIKAKSDFVVAKSALENIIATKISKDETISDFDASVDEVTNIEELQEEMMHNRSEIKAMMFKSKSLVAQRDAVEGRYLPSVDLLARYDLNDKERKSGTNIVQPKDQTTYSVNISWNLYSGGKDFAAQKALLEKDNQQNYELNQLKLDLASQLTKAYQDLIVAKSAKVVAKKAKESAEENYRITADRYSYGDVDTLTLLVSQTSLTQATNADNNAYYNLYVAYKTLRRVVAE